jgi:hypothetical protein
VLDEVQVTVKVTLEAAIVPEGILLLERTQLWPVGEVSVTLYATPDFIPDSSVAPDVFPVEMLTLLSESVIVTMVPAASPDTVTLTE